MPKRIEKQPLKQNTPDKTPITSDWALDMALHMSLNIVRDIRSGKPLEEIESGLIELMSKSPRFQGYSRLDQQPATLEKENSKNSV